MLCFLSAGHVDRSWVKIRLPELILTRTAGGFPEQQNKKQKTKMSLSLFEKTQNFWLMAGDEEFILEYKRQFCTIATSFIFIELEIKVVWHSSHTTQVLAIITIIIIKTHIAPEDTIANETIKGYIWSFLHCTISIIQPAGWTRCIFIPSPVSVIINSSKWWRDEHKIKQPRDWNTEFTTVNTTLAKLELCHTSSWRTTKQVAKISLEESEVSKVALLSNLPQKN